MSTGVRQVYIFEGLDKQKSLEGAAYASEANNEEVTVHFHKSGEPCPQHLHYVYVGGVKDHEWGDDGTADTPVG